MPPRDDDHHLAALEHDFRDVFDHAKAERPDLCIKVLPGLDGDDGSVCAIREHLWVGGECIRGCGQLNPTIE